MGTSASQEINSFIDVTGNKIMDLCDEITENLSSERPNDRINETSFGDANSLNEHRSLEDANMLGRERSPEEILFGGTGPLGKLNTGSNAVISDREASVKGANPVGEEGSFGGTGTLGKSNAGELNTGAVFKDLLYHIELQDGKHYVGVTNNLQMRYQQHVLGKGSEWTKSHPPIKYPESMEVVGLFDEDNEVKRLMMIHGIDNVRGGSYSNIVLTKEQRLALESEITHAKDECFKCNNFGHYAKDCPSNKTVIMKHFNELDHYGKDCPLDKTVVMKCFICGKLDHYGKDCLSNKTVAMKCFKCHKVGHYAKDCPANKTVAAKPTKINKTAKRLYSNNYCVDCGRKEHRRDPSIKCQYKTTRGKNPIKSDSRYCGKCGCGSHDQSQCYAKTRHDGSEF